MVDGKLTARTQGRQGFRPKMTSRSMLITRGNGAGPPCASLWGSLLSRRSVHERNAMPIKRTAALLAGAALTLSAVWVGAPGHTATASANASAFVPPQGTQ